MPSRTSSATARAIRLAGVTAIALTAANCSQQKFGGIDPKYGVAASPKVVRDGEPVPKGGGREMVGRSPIWSPAEPTCRARRAYVARGWPLGTASISRPHDRQRRGIRPLIRSPRPTRRCRCRATPASRTSERSLDHRPGERSRPIPRQPDHRCLRATAEALDFSRKGTAVSGSSMSAAPRPTAATTVSSGQPADRWRPGEPDRRL